MSAKPNEIVTIEPPRNAVTPMEMIANALSSGVSTEVLEKLLTLQERWDKNLGRRAFDKAIAAAKAGIPVVQKNKTGHNNKRYADFAAYAAAIDPVISQYGLSYRFRTVQDDKAIRVTCILSHDDGHSEENTLSGPADSTGSKNAIQAIGSTLTYLQRYTLIQALGLAASEEDDDGGVAAGAGEKVSPEQVTNILAIAEEVGADIPKFCAYLKIKSIPDLPAGRYDAAIAALHAKRAKA